jgi:hypothetical protein
MLQFTVPQFIDVEDKIIGPLTVRQFIIMLVGAIFIFISYKLADFSLFAVEGLLIFGISGIIAFLKVNGMPFHYFILNFLQTLSRPALRVWNQALDQGPVIIEKQKKEEEFIPLPEKHYTASRLAELSLIVDTQGAYQGEESDRETYINPNIDSDLNNIDDLRKLSKK